MEPLQFDEKDCNKWVKIKPEQEFIISLDTFSGAGYIWSAYRTYHHNPQAHLLQLNYTFSDIVDKYNINRGREDLIIGGHAKQIFLGKIKKDTESNKRFCIFLVIELCRLFLSEEERLFDENRKLFNIFLEEDVQYDLE